MKVKTQEQIVKEGWAFLNSYVRAYDSMRKHQIVGENHVTFIDKSVCVINLIWLCDLLNLDYTREDWKGNERCNTNKDIVYFNYKGYRFFELIDKENTDEGK